MADKKATELDIMRPARRIELGDFALAAFYPRTQSGAPLAPIAVATPVAQPLHKRQRDHPSSTECVAKPWKKPWDR
jgi:hypothetical protein